jgi:hypothetical protein
MKLEEQREKRKEKEEGRNKMLYREIPKVYQKKGLPLVPSENCLLYNPIPDTEYAGICRLDGMQVNLQAGCNNPENCYKLKCREIKVVRL